MIPMISVRWAISVCAVSCALRLWPHAAAQAPSGEFGAVAGYARAAIVRGSRLYAANCAVCHGANGDLAPGADFGSGRFRHASTDADLQRIIASGIPDTPMPPGAFDPSELNELVAYIRSMHDMNSGGLTAGDRNRGRLIFETKGQCGTCHRVNGQGPWLAPDLSTIGASRTAAALQQSLVDPTGSMRPINRPVHAVTRGGQVINGRRLNEDTYTVQLIDDRGRLISLGKADLSEFVVVTRSPMPSYRERLSAEELADVVAYLLSLRGPTSQ